ncbi:MAG: 3-keto-5-aminohexanoate cleavage protein, partial [Kiloniellales bacterium]
TACALTATALGGHARVGFENNLYLPGGSIATDNAALVRSVAGGAAAIGRPVARADETRAVMGAAGS